MTVVSDVSNLKLTTSFKKFTFLVYIRGDTEFHFVPSCSVLRCACADMEMLSLNIYFPILWFIFLERNCNGEHYIRTGRWCDPTSPSHCSIRSVRACEQLLTSAANIKSCDFLPPPTIKATPLCWRGLPCDLLVSASSSTTQANRGKFRNAFT